MSRRQLEISGYLRAFPHLLGVVSCMQGTESDIRSLVERPDWAGALSATELVLAPAACYPVYPMAGRGVLYLRMASGLTLPLIVLDARRQMS